MLDNLKFQVIRTLSTFQIRLQEEQDAIEEAQRQAAAQAAQQKSAQERRPKLAQIDKALAKAAKNPAEFNKLTDEQKQLVFEHTPRNARCPCGSGKKFKDCHGKITS